MAGTTLSGTSAPADRAAIRDILHAHGLRWTPQRQLLIEVLSRTDGHVTGAELVERCRAEDPATTPSTVYRTLDVLEDLGLVRHHHGADGRETFHVQPLPEHGHLLCRSCGGSWEIGAGEATALVEAVRAGRGFAVDLSHLTVTGQCAACLAAEATVGDGPDTADATAGPERDAAVAIAGPEHDNVPDG